MLFAWYSHLQIKGMAQKPFWVVALISWSIALVEYLILVPANRIGHTVMSVAQLKILQEVISLTVFIPFSLIMMKEKLNWNFLWAGLCMLGAVYFIFFRGR